MNRRKTVSAALFVTLFGTMLFLPPLLGLVHNEARIFGAPVELIYMFAAWAALVVAAVWLGKHLPDERGEGGDG
jgi:hypothetical protein